MTVDVLEGVAMKIWVTIVVLILAVGCGNGDGGAPTGKASPDVAKAAHRLAQKGKVEELRAALAEDPEIVNTPVMRGSLLLDVVLDTRPAFKNMHQSIQVLLEAGADPNASAPHLLRKAIWHGDPETLQLLLDHGADPTVVDPRKKRNMLEYARSTGDERLAAIVDAWEAAQKK